MRLLGLEPKTYGLKGRCSTDLATLPKIRVHLYIEYANPARKLNSNFVHLTRIRSFRLTLRLGMC